MATETNNDEFEYTIVALFVHFKKYGNVFGNNAHQE